MIYGIIYTTITIICLGIILYINDLDFDDSDAIVAVLVSILWIATLPVIVLLGLGYCVKLLLNKIFKIMKNFRLEVPKGQTDCKLCPFYTSNINFNTNVEFVCKWLLENDICNKYDFTKFHLWDDLEENKVYEENRECK